MAKTILGVEFGNAALKLALCDATTVRDLVVEPIPENLVDEGRVTSPEAMAQFLKDTMKKHRLKAGKAAVLLPASQSFVRRTTMPLVSEEQLKLNLPYEFRDYITEEKDKYIYDYAVLGSAGGEGEQAQQIDLIACAALRTVIKSYVDLFRWAGLKLVTAIPAELAFSNLLRIYESSRQEPAGKERCFVDLGHAAIRLYIYTGPALEVVRNLDVSGAGLDQAIADALDMDVHAARSRKIAGLEGVLDLEGCRTIYQAASTDILRALNFYRYNNPNSTLEDVRLFGGGVENPSFVEFLRESLEMPLPVVDSNALSQELRGLLPQCLGAVGAAMQ